MTPSRKNVASVGEGKTVGELIPVYLEERSTDLRLRTHLEVTRHLKIHWKPLHPLKVKGVSRQDIVHVIDDLVEVNGKGAADRARSALSTFFAGRFNRNYRDANPTLNIKARGSNAGRSRVLVDGELAEFGRLVSTMITGKIVNCSYSRYSAAPKSGI